MIVASAAIPEAAPAEDAAVREVEPEIATQFATRASPAGRGHFHPVVQLDQSLGLVRDGSEKKEISNWS